MSGGELKVEQRHRDAAADELSVLSAPSGFDPSREMGFWFTRPAKVAALLDEQDRENATRRDFKPAISREMADRAINGLFSIRDCRSSDTAAAYAWMSLWNALGVDWRASKMVFKQPASAMSAQSAEPASCPNCLLIGERVKALVVAAEHAIDMADEHGGIGWYAALNQLQDAIRSIDIPAIIGGDRG